MTDERTIAPAGSKSDVRPVPTSPPEGAEVRPEELRDVADREALLEKLRGLAQWTALIAAPAFYLFGRLLTDSFYGRFSVSPDEVGLTYFALVVPAAVATVTVVAAVVAVIIALRLA